MSASGQSTGAIIRGYVSRLSANGLQLNDEPTWLNYSRFATVPRPNKADFVEVAVNPKGVISGLKILASDHDQAEGAPVQNGTATISSAPPPPALTEGVSATGVDSHRQYLRTALLSAASRFAASRPEMKAKDVLTVAQAWERWVIGE